MTHKVDDRDSWEDEFLKLHYEPEHQSGGMCWCGVEYHKIPEGMEIKHIEQRDILRDFIRTLLSHHLEAERARLKGEVEGMKIDAKTWPEKTQGMVKEMLIQPASYNSAINDILSLLSHPEEDK